MNRIKGDLEVQKGVSDVTLNQATGSVTVHYDRKRLKGDSIFKLLNDVDVIVEALTHAPSIVQPVPQGEAGGTTFTLVEAIDDLNERVFSLTGIRIDLKILLPLAFIAAVLWSVSVNGLMIETLPAWLFLWFAFDLFVKLHPVRA